MADATLRELADQHGLTVGAAVAGDTLRNDPHYRGLLKGEFNAITTENALKMGELRPDPNRFDFADADAIVSFGEVYGMSVRGHTLVWHNQQPDWLRPWERTDDQLEQFLRTHIHTVAGRYRSTIDVWDVVNEAVLDDGSMRETVWYDAMGEAYIEKAFHWANEVAPDATLCYNDYNAEGMNPKADGVYELLSRLLDRGVPIDAVGLQMHALHEKPDLEAVGRNVERLQELGLEVHLTEIDVAYPDADKPEHHRTAQANFYRELLELALAADINTVVTWGVRDSDSWIRSWFPDLTDDPLLFDKHNETKPAYDAIVSTLAETSSEGSQSARQP